MTPGALVESLTTSDTRYSALGALVALKRNQCVRTRTEMQSGSWKRQALYGESFHRKLEVPSEVEEFIGFY